MKHRYKLIENINKLKEKYNINALYPKTKYTDLQKLINQVYKLTTFLDNKHITFRRLSVRINYVANNLKDIEKCEMCCDNKISTYKSRFCCNKCHKKYFDLTETDENKKARLSKAVSNRNYTEILIKGNATKKNNPEIMERYRYNLNITLNTITENGLTVAQNRGRTFSNNSTEEFLKHRADKSAQSRKENGTNSALSYWSSLSEEESHNEKIKRSKATNETKINLGIIKPVEDRDQFEIYCQSAAFKHGFKTNNENERLLLEQYGIFNNKINTKGCVRDHLLSRRYGFDNNIDAEIIGHPANCEIVLHSENIRRANGNDNLITLDELLERIKNWNK